MYACFLGNAGESEGRATVSRSASAVASMFTIEKSTLNIAFDLIQ